MSSRGPAAHYGMKTMAAEDWTPDRIAMLRRLCAEGLSFDTIGGLMGISRSAAIGKAKRLGIQKFPAKPSPRQRPVTACGKRILTPRIVTSEPVKAADDAPAPLMVPLLDLEPNMCRWPCGDPRDPAFGFCGHEARTGSSWCEHHYRRAFAGCPSVSRGKLPMREAA